MTFSVNLGNERLLRAYRQMKLIREFEERLHVEIATGEIPGFTKRYDVKRLVHYEPYEDYQAAIAREKKLKRWRRDWKRSLIEEPNQHWIDLFPAIAPGFTVGPGSDAKRIRPG